MNAKDFLMSIVGMFTGKVSITVSVPLEAAQKAEQEGLLIWDQEKEQYVLSEKGKDEFRKKLVEDGHPDLKVR